ncbi:methylenetetrahydrofolate reductase C-terminal domain-containing protein [bacterium]|nr:methylenetetrahydrofolate reductase C-terminal domain-containing protein [bacterium]
MEQLREALKQGRFVIGAELVTTRGRLQQANGQRLLGLADELSRDTRLSWLSFTDNAGGNPMIAPDSLAGYVLRQGKDVVINMTCKDGNRNMLESLAWKYASEGVQNLLVLTGDYPASGYRGIAGPVFDLDSVGLLTMLSDLNSGLKTVNPKTGQETALDKTDFFLGCTVSPFKMTEAELMMQFQKLMMKINAGAQFVIPQLGYDIRKSHELLGFLTENQINIPLIANIYLLSPGVARMFNQGKIAGCTVSDGLLERVYQARQSPDKGKSFYINFAAMQIVAHRQLGYKGAYIGGFDNYADFKAILERAAVLESASWPDIVTELTHPRAGEFYLYVRDEQTGLADHSRKNPDYYTYRRRDFRRHVSLAYRFYRLVHRVCFSYSSPLFGGAARWYRLLEKKRLRWLNRLAYFNEKMWKTALFGCQECGDCSLPDITYLCPGENCAKNLRNGPCGGSQNERCELTQREKDCIWVKAYCRNKYYQGNSAPLLNHPAVIRDHSLRFTSGWANCFLLRDHNAYQRFREQ